MNRISPRRTSAQHIVIVMIAVPILAAAITVHAGEKTGSTMITAEMRANAVLNVERYGWARDRVDQLRRRVRPYKRWFLGSVPGLSGDDRGTGHHCPDRSLRPV